MRLLKNVYTKMYRQRFSGNKYCVGIQIARSQKRKTRDWKLQTVDCLHPETTVGV